MSDPTPGDLQQAMAALAAGPARGGGDRGTTSDLSVDEVLLLHSIGWEPVDLVFGVSWWSVPWGVWPGQGGGWQGQPGEVESAGRAFAGAMGEASTQMRDQSAHVGAAGVVGVRLGLRVSSRHVDVSLSGTAVRPSGQDRRAHSGEFISDLSARDFTLLLRAGWWPLGLAAGACFVVAPRRGAREWAAQQGQNVELPNLTNALYLARERAMERMQAAGQAFGADGLVDVKLREGPLGRSSRVIQFVAVGTAVHLHEERHRTLTPEMVVSLDDPIRQFEAASLRGAGSPPGPR